MKNRNKSTVDYSVVNRLKIETIEEFGNSLFASQYEDASILVSEIISNNCRIENCRQSCNECCNGVCSKTNGLDYEHCNIVPFLGGRGTGKTSAMFSYSEFLRDYSKITNNRDYQIEIDNKMKAKNKDAGIARFLLDGYTESCNGPTFLMLNPIDASALEGGEGVLEVVLAKMWDYYDQEVKKGNFEIASEMQAEMAKGFSDLKSDYQSYLQSANQGDISNIKQLHNLASSLNFRATFQKLLKRFLGLFCYNNSRKMYLVLMLDDIDMAGENSFRMLEQLHLFLCIPDIIVLMTADLSRLRQICGDYYCKIYAKWEIKARKSTIVDFDDNYTFIRRKNEFADDYLGKIIPSNMRIFMPDIYLLNPQIVQGNKQNLTISEEMLRIFYTHGIYFDGVKGKHHFWEEKTLRKNANLLHSLKRVEKKSGNKTAEYLLDWVRINIKERLLDRIEITSQRESLENIFYFDTNELNLYFVEIIGDEKSEYTSYPLSGQRKDPSDKYRSQSAVANYGLGEVLYGCSMLQNQARNYAPFVDLILAYYTVLYAECENDEEDISRLIRRSIWGNWTDSMIINFNEYVNANVEDRRAMGINMSNLVLELVVSVEELEKYKELSIINF